MSFFRILNLLQQTGISFLLMLVFHSHILILFSDLYYILIQISINGLLLFNLFLKPSYFLIIRCLLLFNILFAKMQSTIQILHFLLKLSNRFVIALSILLE